MSRGGLPHTIFASAVTSYITLHIASGLGRAALTALALAHGYDTAFWWIAGIFAAGAIIGGSLLRRGPLYRKTARPSRMPGSWRRRQGPPSPRDAAAHLRYAPVPQHRGAHHGPEIRT